MLFQVGKKAAEVDRSRLSLYHRVSVFFELFFRAGKSGHFATHFRARPYPELGNRSGICSTTFFFFLLAKVVSSRKTCFFSRPDFFEKKTGSPSFAFSCSHTAAFAAVVVDHHYYLSQIECKDISFFFRSQFSRTTFFATFPESRQSPNFACGPRVADIALNFPVGFLRQFHLEEDPPPLSFFPLHLAGPVG